MGLLDDAIREHLELKRRSGADPGEIAHKEHEALAPVFPDEEAAALNAPTGGSTVEDDPAEELPPVVVSSPAEGGPPPGAAAADFTHVGQETAELDMSSVLAERDDSPVAPVVARPARAAQAPADTEQDSAAPALEPSAEGASADARPPEEIPGQERLAFE